MTSAKLVPMAPPRNEKPSTRRPARHNKNRATA